MPDGFAIEFKSPAQVGKEEAKKAEGLRAIPTMTEDTFTGLSGYIKTCWTDAKDFKRPTQDMTAECARRRKGKYDDTKLAAIREAINGSENYIRAVNTKCRAAYTSIYDIYNSLNVNAWSIKPTPVPSLPIDLEMGIITRVQQEIMTAPVPLDDEAIKKLDERAHKEVMDAINEEAKKRAELMQTRIDDILTEGGWRKALNECFNDLVTYPAAILKGPILRRQPKKQWVMDNQTGKHKLVVKDKLIWEFERVSPFDFYPARNIEGTNDGYCFHRLRLNRRKLIAMKGIKGYNDNEIDAVLTECSQGISGTKWLYDDNDIQADEAEDRTQFQTSPEGRIDGLEFWGEVQGQMLRDWGMGDKDIPDPLKEYQVTAILIGNHTVRAALNHSPLYKKPFHKVSWEEVEGAFWGQGIPQIAADIDDPMQAIIRALINNVAVACLTGDTIVYRSGQGGNGKGLCEVTLRELWETKNKYNSGLRRTILRSLDEESGQLFANRIVDIFDNGVQPVYEVLTENGYRIKATINHRFMNSFGEWIALSEFTEGDDIAVNGQENPPQKLCIECGAKIGPTSIRCRKCNTILHNRNEERQAAENRDANATTARQRKACKDARREVCEICGSDRILEVHHKDRSPWNNDPDNLICLCNNCHKYEHKRHDNLGDPYKHKYIDYDKIIRIKYVGCERVYDLQMTTPNHNFVANGFISHNSGPILGIDKALLPDGVDIEHIIPWMIIALDSSKNIGGMNGSTAKLPIDWFQPEMRTSELLNCLNAFMKMLDEYTGVPAYTYGIANTGQEGKTASGMQMMIAAAGKIIANVTSRIDSDFIESSIGMVYDNLMLYDPDESIKGDAEIVAGGASSVIAKGQQLIRLLELLDRTRNDIDMQIIGFEGRAEMLKKVFHQYELNLDDVIPDKEVLLAREQANRVAENLAKTGNLAQPAPQNLDAAGSPVSGTDTAEMLQRTPVAQG